MGLIDSWTRAAASRGHVLIAEARGAFRQRVALERAVDAAGWCATGAIADADVLAVVGEPSAELMAVIDHAWEQMSEPRARIDVRGETDLAAALEGARETLRSSEEQRARARRRPGQEAPGHDDHHDQDHHHDHHDEQHTSHDDHGDDDVSDEHAGHDHGDMSPDGIPLAEGAEDRDGLEMDELHLPLGPVLAHWPAGLVLRLTLHGDVVSGAEVEQLDAAGRPSVPDDGETRAARLLDAAASVLSLAGLPGEAARATRLRDRCLVGDQDVAESIEGLVSRVRRHRVLRWVLKGLAVTSEDGRREELHERLVGLLERALVAREERPATTGGEGPSLEALPDLVRGQELAAVRLWMAVLRADLAHDVAAEV